MSDRVNHPPHLIYSPGTQVVTTADVLGESGRVLHPCGAVGVVVTSPRDLEHSYRVRFPDGTETALDRTQIVQRAFHQQGDLGDFGSGPDRAALFDRVILRCVVGSRAYGLDHAGSDVDRRGIYLPPADAQWSLYGVPDQLDRDATQETYWELQRFLVLALKANPNVLECLWTPLVETTTPLGEELLGMRDAFLSRLVYQTFNGYVMSQFKKIQADVRNHGEPKRKHVMHLIRLLLSGIGALRDGRLTVHVDEHRERLLEIRDGRLPFAEIERWRTDLHREFDDALRTTRLPERPDYAQANAFLVKARRAALSENLP